MIGYLRGKIIEISEAEAIVGVGAIAGDSGVVGYQISIPQSTAIHLEVDEETELFVYTHVREDTFRLYGFRTPVEKEFFQILIGVNGIGPKAALNLLSHSTVSDLAQAILDGNSSCLCKVPGIGKKTAERIILDLTDPVQKKIESGAIVVNPPEGDGTEDERRVIDEFSKLTQLKTEEKVMMKEAKEALIGLGYKENDVEDLIEKVVVRTGPPQKVEDLIRAALQNLGNFL